MFGCAGTMVAGVSGIWLLSAWLAEVLAGSVGAGVVAPPKSSVTVSMAVYSTVEAREGSAAKLAAPPGRSAWGRACLWSSVAVVTFSAAGEVVVAVGRGWNLVSA